MEKNKKEAFFLIAVIAIGLIVFTIFSTFIPFNDGEEYLIMAKYIAGIKNINVFALHSALYPFLAAPFISIFKHILAFQFLTTGIVVLTGIALWYATRSLKAILLWGFSALTWHSIGSIASIIPAAFCLLLAYCFWNRWDKANQRIFLYFSGLFLGLSSSFYEGGWPVSFIFLLVFFYRKKFKDFLPFLIFALLGFSARIMIDYLVVGSAFSSTIRMFFGNIYVILGHHPENHVTITWYRIIDALIIISPLIIITHRLFKQYKEEFFFLTFSFLVMALIPPSVKYLYIIMPVAILFLSKVVNKKEILIHIGLSLPFVILFISAQISEEWTFLGTQEDIRKLEEDYSGMIIADKDLELILASQSWGEKIDFVWRDEYLASQNENPIVKRYEYHEKVKEDFYKSYFLTFGDEFISKMAYPDNLPLITRSYLNPSIPDYKLERCYRVLCIYRK